MRLGRKPQARQLPGKLVLQSPGLQVPPSEEQKEEMKKREKADIMIPPCFFDRIAPVLATGDDAYLLSPLLADLTGFPPIDLFRAHPDWVLHQEGRAPAKCRDQWVLDLSNPQVREYLI